MNYWLEIAKRRWPFPLATLTPPAAISALLTRSLEAIGRSEQWPATSTDWLPNVLSSKSGGVLGRWR
jgi:hypothetical protein